MFDWKMLLIILAIALVIFGTKRLRTIGSDLGAGIKGFKDGIRGEDEKAMPLISNGEDSLNVHVPSEEKAIMNSQKG